MERDAIHGVSTRIPERTSIQQKNQYFIFYGSDSKFLIPLSPRFSTTLLKAAIDLVLSNTMVIKPFHFYSLKKL